MALSNIFNEPRREITETVLGVLVVGSLLFGDWWLASALETDPPGAERIGGIIVLMFALPIGLILVLLVGYGLVRFAHFMGEVACDLLEDTGLRLRPVREEPVRKYVIQPASPQTIAAANAALNSAMSQAALGAYSSLGMGPLSLNQQLGLSGSVNPHSAAGSSLEYRPEV